MTPAELAAIRERCEKATAGPWAAWNAYACAGGTHLADAECVHIARVGPTAVDCRMGIVANGGRADLNGRRDDFQFIVHARSDIPRLLALVARQQAVVEAAETWSHWGKVKALHVLTCKECERLEGAEDRWCDEATKIGRAQLDAAKALNDALTTYQDGGA